MARSIHSDLQPSIAGQQPWPTVENRTGHSGWPAWLLSVVLHSVLLMMLVVVLEHRPQGAVVEPDRTAGITLVKHHQGEREYFDADDALATDSLQVADPGEPARVPGLDAVRIDMDSLLPTEHQGVGTTTNAMSAAPQAGQLGGGTAKSVDVGGSTRTGVFGVYGEGTRFVYVFDRSGSMDFMGGRPLAAAKRELLASLDDLARTNQFQIVFYNEKPSPFHPHGERPRMEWADGVSKALAATFVDEISATGGTSHMLALRMALRMRPDVIFFLTDADEPSMSPAELREIKRTNRGTTICSVEFGNGPQQSTNNFLSKLARQNGGQHVYVDTSTLPAAP